MLEAETEGLEISSVLSGRLGAFDMVNSSDSYDAVFDDPMPQLGVGYELRFDDRWFVEAVLDHGEIDGERVLLTDPPTPTGVEQTLTLTPLHVTVGWAAFRARSWRLLFGVGPTLLRYDLEEESGTEPGGHGVVRLQREAERWTVGGEIRYSTIPGVDLGEDSILEFFDEDDLGGVSAHLVVGYRWGGA